MREEVAVVIGGVSKVVIDVEDQERSQGILDGDDGLRARPGRAVRRGALAGGASTRPGREPRPEPSPSGAGRSKGSSRLFADFERDVPLR